MKKLICFTICLSLLLPVLPLQAKEAAASDIDLAPHAEAAYLIEYTSGKVLYKKKENEKLYPASMTKMMGLLLIFEALHEGKLDWDEQVVTSAYAAGMGGSQVYLEENETMSVRDMVKSICIASANDAMVAMGEKLGGTNDHFVAMMNEKAEALHMANTHFTNATGLHDTKHYTTAKDMALLAQALIKEGGEELLDITSTYDAYIREDSAEAFWLVNTNKLLKQYDGVDGLKSGYTSQAGSCITITAQRQGLRFIAVVMKEPDSKTRNQEIQTMLDYGFSQYEQKTLYEKGKVVAEKTIENGSPQQIKLYTEEAVTTVYEKGTTPKVKTKEVILDKQRAPYKKGKVIGRLCITMTDGQKLEAKLCVDRDVEALGFLDILFKSFCDVLS